MFTLPPLSSPGFPGIIDDAPVSTSVGSKAALYTYAFFGLNRPGAAKLDSLVQFSDAQFASYKAQGVSRPELGPYEALGRALVHDGTFESRYGALTDSSFVNKAYSEIFERSATPNQATHFQSQISYFHDLYRTAGIGTSEASILAKGAVAGQMLGFAALDENARAPTAATGFDFF